MTRKDERPPQGAPAPDRPDSAQPDAGQPLRKRAETALLERGAHAAEQRAEMSHEAMQRVLHELRVHQIELEMQNEELRRAQVQLDAARARFFDLYEFAPVGYVTLNEQGQILQANLTAATLLRVPRGALADKPFHRFILAADQDTYYLYGKHLRQSPEPAECEVRTVSEDGSTRWLHLVASLAQNMAGAPEIRLTLSDVTARKLAQLAQAKLEVQLHHAQKSEIVGRLAGGVAHDFNNMLSLIMGHADLALDRTDAAQPIHADLIEIQKAAQHSAALTRQLLAFARKQPVVPAVLDVNAITTAMLSMLRPLLGEGITLTWQPTTTLWSVKMDPSQLTQLLTNLCVNARDAIHDIGTITLASANCVIDASFCATHAEAVPGEYVRLSVQDNGPGMDPHTLSHIFEPFFTTKEVGKGTGLGLATVYGVVQQNLGFICVRSGSGQGSTFEIYLPRHVGLVEPTDTAAVAEPGFTGHETILLVEDEPALLHLTTRILLAQGYVVLAAATPHEAIGRAATHAGTIDLLLSDVIMPGMNGRELANTLLRLRPQLRCMFMSGYTADIIAHHGVLDDGLSFIEKPFANAALIARVRGVLESAKK